MQYIMLESKLNINQVRWFTSFKKKKFPESYSPSDHYTRGFVLVWMLGVLLCCFLSL